LLVIVGGFAWCGTGLVMLVLPGISALIAGLGALSILIPATQRLLDHGTVDHVDACATHSRRHHHHHSERRQSMNRATLAELQRQRCYPSITVLVNTTPGSALTPSELDTTTRLTAEADGRLDGDISDTLRHHLIDRLRTVITEQAGQPSTDALAVFVSPDHTAAIRLGRRIDERVTIDDTFTTRDIVADLNRTAAYRVITISEQRGRLFIGDRQRLVEQHDTIWPLTRTDDQTPTTWARDLNRHLQHEHTAYPLPTVIAGVQRSIRKLVPSFADSIGIIAGNHDRTNTTDLHHASWPIVTDWLRTDAARALQQLDQALSANRYAGGIHEIWALAHDGRIATLVVENDYTLPARIDHNNQLHPADDRHHPAVNDDIVDDAIETVLQHGGTAIIVNGGVLADHNHIAAILRY
jgi:hypothetical protein